MLSLSKISVAPMMGYTDRHARFLYRLISPDAVLYTEMLTAKALIHGDHQYLLRFNAIEHPIVLQLGGASDREMASAAILGEQAGFDEININVGCPSNRVLSGAFGACLMKEPDAVAACVKSMKQSTDLPITVKIRTGVDDFDSYQLLTEFIETVAAAGCSTFIVHARKAWLKGLSPKQNREIPPLQYEWVYQLKEDFPRRQIIINGGIRSVDEVKAHLGFVDGVMLGREVIRNPWILYELGQLESMRESTTSTTNRQKIASEYIIYIKNQLEMGASLHLLLRPLYGLAFGLPGARKWRQGLSRLSSEKMGLEKSLSTVTELIEEKSIGI